MVNVVMRCAVMLNDVMLSGVVLNVVMLIAVHCCCYCQCRMPCIFVVILSAAMRVAFMLKM